MECCLAMDLCERYRRVVHYGLEVFPENEAALVDRKAQLDMPRLALPTAQLGDGNAGGPRPRAGDSDRIRACMSAAPQRGSRNG